MSSSPGNRSCCPRAAPYHPNSPHGIASPAKTWAFHFTLNAGGKNVKHFMVGKKAAPSPAKRGDNNLSTIVVKKNERSSEGLDKFGRICQDESMISMYRIRTCVSERQRLPTSHPFGRGPTTLLKGLNNTHHGQLNHVSVTSVRRTHITLTSSNPTGLERRHSLGVCTKPNPPFRGRFFPGRKNPIPQGCFFCSPGKKKELWFF